jgi:hypothetical protein
MCTLICAIRKVPETQDRVKLNGAHQLLAYVALIHWSGIEKIMKRKGEVVLISSNEVGLEVIVEKNNYIWRKMHKSYADQVI